MGAPLDASVNGSVSSFVLDDPGVGVKRTRTLRSRRRPDYRLRGLDLGKHEAEPAPPQPVRKERSRPRHRRRLVTKLVPVLLVATLAAVLLRSLVVEPFSVPSASMVPTLKVGDRILVVKSSRLVGPIQSGDIVVFRHPKPFPCGSGRDQFRDLVERVIGVPGETIWSDGNRIEIDGRQLKERGWYDAKYGQVGSTPIRRTKIPPGKYFVMADNRSYSCDSRAFGTVARTSIVGKVLAILMRDGHLYFHVF